jgi:hypothetical protein
MGYDIIGDIHGHADKLEALLQKLEYENQTGTWRHSERQAIFVGDFIDRGPKQLESVKLVRRMVDDGAALAVMGNHEFNAIAWHTPDPNKPGDYLRTRTEAHHVQHQQFLDAVKDNPSEHANIIDWFLTLPLWIDLPDLRVVHACWHTSFIEWVSPRLHRDRYLTRELMVEATRKPKPPEEDTAEPSVFKAVEALAKGIEVPLPKGKFFLDKDGTRRDRVRVQWWDEHATTLHAAAILPEKTLSQFPDAPIPEHARIETGGKSVFFGHYWLTGQPVLQSPKATCVDYSAGNGGALVAYRFDGEQELSLNKFISVP